ncbi:type IX secretion system sortase PorU [bacterium]|nr:type IX secretion system sortase PorU [bacterium]
MLIGKKILGNFKFFTEKFFQVLQQLVFLVNFSFGVIPLVYQTFLFLLVFLNYAFANSGIQVQPTTSEVVFTYFPGVTSLDTLDKSKVRIAIDGLNTNAENGELLKTFLVAVPENSNPTVEILETQFKNFAGFTLDKKNAENIVSELVKIEKTGFLRFLPTASVTINPLVLQAGSFKLLTKIKVKINFNSQEKNFSQSKISQKETEFCASKVINPSFVSYFAKNDSQTMLKKATDNLGKTYKIQIQDEGIYKITGSWLTQNIENFSLNEIPSTKKIRLFGLGAKRIDLKIFPETTPKSFEEFTPEIAIEVVDNNSNDKFDADDYFLFYGKALNFWESIPQTNGEAKITFTGMNPYDTKNYYFLNFDSGTDGKRIAKINSQNSSVNETNYTKLIRGEVDKINPFHTGTRFFAGLMTYSGSGDGNVPTEANPTINFTDFVQGTSADYSFNFVSYDFYEYVSGGYKNNFTIFANNSLLNQATNTTGSWSNSILDKEIQGSFPLTTQNYSFKTKFSVSPIDGQSAFDFYEFRYQRMLKAENNELVFWGKQGSETRNYKLTDFTTQPKIFDVTNFEETLEITGANFSNGNLTFGASGLSEKHKLYFVTQNFKTPEKITPKIFGGTLHKLRDTSHSADFIIVTHSDFYDEAIRLKNFKEGISDPNIFLKTEVVLVEDIFDEFSGGVYDALAIRDFLHYTFYNWKGTSGTETPPQYVLFFGDSDYDFRNLEFNTDKNWVPSYQLDATSDISYRATDDKFCFLTGGPNDAQLDIASGRITVSSTEEAKNVVDKIIEYEGSPILSDWRSRITLVGDDEFGSFDTEFIHIFQSETLAGIIKGSGKGYDLKKIYLPEYPTVSDATAAKGRGKPQAAEELVDTFNNVGTLLVNYIGHGNPTNWAHERVFNQDRHLNRLTNEKLPLIIAATCDFGEFDRADGSKSFTEDLLGRKEAGGIGVFSASRITLSNSNANLNNYFFTQLFRTQNPFKRVGEAVLEAKNLNEPGRFDENEEKYYFFGDPTLIFASPRLKIGNLQIPENTFKALSVAEIKGTILDEDGSAWQNFNGTITIKTLDATKNRPFGNSSYSLQGNTIFKGAISSVSGGNFTAKFFVPKDITYGGTSAKALVYFSDENKNSRLRFDGSGVLEGIVLSGGNVTLTDTTGPKIETKIQTSEFAKTIETLLEITLEDTISGINLTGKQGHRITLIFDGNEDEIFDLTEKFTYDSNSFTKGKIAYKVEGISEGEHTFKITAWDNFNNASEFKGSLVFAASVSFRLADVYNFPNPMQDETKFTFKLLSNASSNVNVSIKIYTLAGRLIQTLNEELPFDLNNFYAVEWNGKDRDGDKISNGTYFYNLEVKSEKLKTSAKGKLVIIR